MIPHKMALAALLLTATPLAAQPIDPRRRRASTESSSARR
jgi:hypothetical protein